MARQAVMAVLHDVDPDYLPDLEKEIWDAVGKFETELWGVECLVAPFHQSPRRKSGLIVPGGEQTMDDQYQSKSFMILQLGLLVEAACEKNKRPVPKVGKWYWGFPNEHDFVSVRGDGAKNRPSINGQPYRDFKGWPCRLVSVNDIRGTAPRPWEMM